MTDPVPDPSPEPPAWQVLLMALTPFGVAVLCFACIAALIVRGR